MKNDDRDEKNMDKIEKNDNRIRVMSEEKPAKAVVKMGVPLIASMMIMVLYNLTDTYFIGLLHDDYQLAAVNLAYPVMMVSMAISNMIGTGASSLIARSLGAGDKELADHTLTAGFLLTGINSLVVMTAGLLETDENDIKRNILGWSSGFARDDADIGRFYCQ